MKFRNRKRKEPSVEKKREDCHPNETEESL